MIKNIFLLLFSLHFSACVHAPKSHNTETYLAPRGKTWEVLVYIFKKSYPIQTIDIDKGYIETKALKDSKYWTAPHQKNINTNGLSSVIKAYLFYDKPYSKVEIQKTTSRKVNFFSSSKMLNSDFLEEKNILYRIKRELYIRKGFDKINRSN